MVSRKVSLHVTGSLDGLGSPTVLKLYLADVAQVARARSVVGPTCLLVVRWYHAQQPVLGPEQCADNWFAAHEQDIRRMIAYSPIVFEGYNEIGDELADAYARFELRRLTRLHGVGARGAVGSWSAGTPSESTWPKYAPALDAMIAGDITSLHEYWSDHADLENRWHVARFAQTSIAPFLVGKQIVITECGRDYMPDTKKGAAGWRRTCTADEYLGDLRRLGEIYDQYPQVIGATVFQRGLGEWGMFEVASLWPRVVAEYAGATPVPSPSSGTTPSAPLPNDEQGNAKLLAVKARWWAEEMQRCFEAGNLARAEAIRLSLIQLLYRLEMMLT